MNKRLIGVVVLLAFAVTLAVVLGLRLSGTAAAVALGVATGVIVGVPVGVVTALLAQRWGLLPPPRAHYATWDDLEPGILMLTPEQAEVLNTILQRPQTIPGVLGRPASPRDREFTVVGGANLGQSSEE